MTPETFLVRPPLLDGYPRLDPTLDVLSQPDALLETQLLEVRSAAVVTRAVCLVDLKGSLYIDDGNVALVLAEGVERASWTTTRLKRQRSAWTILGSQCEEEGGALHLHLGCMPDGHAELVAQRLTFVIGDMPGMDEAPPDYTEATDEEIWAGNPTWDKPFTPLAVARRTVTAPPV